VISILYLYCYIDNENRRIWYVRAESQTIASKKFKKYLDKMEVETRYNCTTRKITNHEIHIDNVRFIGNIDEVIEDVVISDMYFQNADKDN
jgi:hypothetical protein